MNKKIRNTIMAGAIGVASLTGMNSCGPQNSNGDSENIKKYEMVNKMAEKHNQYSKEYLSVSDSLENGLINKSEHEEISRLLSLYKSKGGTYDEVDQSFPRPNKNNPELQDLYDKISLKIQSILESASKRQLDEMAKLSGKMEATAEAINER